ncbi:MAG: lactate racemase domain-containing protein [Anaerolineae bacterium]
MVTGKGYRDRLLEEAEVRAVFHDGLTQLGLRGKRVLVIIPDGTRSLPMPLCFRLLTEYLEGVAAKLDFLIALGTHLRMSEESILEHLGITAQERTKRFAQIGIYNHDWQHDLLDIGVLPAAEVARESGGYVDQDVRVQVNRRILDYDQLLICGPVYPHEVVGFSGGSKYLFPGISGVEVTNLTHWLAGMLGNLHIIGREDTPVRRLLDRAAALVPVPTTCISLVVSGERDLAGLFFGSPKESQAAAAELSAQVNVRYVPNAYRTVLSVMPDIYDDFWTACKGVFKAEPVVADGGRLIVYAPHIDEVSYTHGGALNRVGYHVSGYYREHAAEFADVNPLVMGHAALVKGAGSYRDGVERPRIEVVLATRIPPERCQRINLGYLDPESIKPEEWLGRESEGALVIPRAGEVLYRLREKP